MEKISEVSPMLLLAIKKGNMAEGIAALYTINTFESFKRKFSSMDEIELLKIIAVAVKGGFMFKHIERDKQKRYMIRSAALRITIFNDILKYIEKSGGKTDLLEGSVIYV